MTRPRFLLVALLASTMLLPRRATCQDSTRVVVLSPRLGPVIDLAKRDQFHIFSMIDGFRQATVLQARSGSFYVLFTLALPPSSQEQKLVPYGRTALEMIAEKVDHFESILENEYTMGTDRAILRYGDGSIVEAAPIMPLRKPEAARQRIPGEGITNIRSSETRREEMQDLFPFAMGTPPAIPERYPFISFAFGISTYSPDDGAFAEMMHAYETLYESRGIPVGTVPEIGLNDFMLWYEARVQVTPTWGGALEVGEARTGSEIVLKSATLALIYRFTVTPDGPFWPYAEVGVTRMDLSVDKTILYEGYIPSLSAYAALQIRGGGSSTGLSITLGGEFAKSSESCIGGKFFFRYLMVPGVEIGSTWGDTRTLKLQSLTAGISLQLMY